MSAWATRFQAVQQFLKDPFRLRARVCMCVNASRGFIRKVYGILGAQMVVTTIIASHSPRLACNRSVALQVERWPERYEDFLLTIPLREFRRSVSVGTT